jgi:hypothetical protein
MIKEPRTVPQPIMLTIPLDKYFLPNPLIKNPINGRRGIQNIKFFIFNLQVPYFLKAVIDNRNRRKLY